MWEEHRSNDNNTELAAKKTTTKQNKKQERARERERERERDAFEKAWHNTRIDTFQWYTNKNTWIMSVLVFYQQPSGNCSLFKTCWVFFQQVKVIPVQTKLHEGLLFENIPLVLHWTVQPSCMSRQLPATPSVSARAASARVASTTKWPRIVVRPAFVHPVPLIVTHHTTHGF